MLFHCFNNQLVKQQISFDIVMFNIATFFWPCLMKKL